MKKLKPLNITNTIIKLFFFFTFPAAWATGFSGVKYLCEQIHSGKPVEMTAFLTAFIALAAFTIVFGRFFCGRACAFGTYGDILHELAKLIAKKTHKKMPKLGERAAARMRYIKYAVLIAVCLMCILGYSSVVSGASPWTAFSHLRTGKVETGSTLDIIGLVLFAAISVCMLFVERFFCRFLCPFGAVFSLLPVLPFSVVSRDKQKCIKGCKACHTVCPAGLDLQYHPDAAGAAKDAATGLTAEAAAAVTEAERDYAAKMGECFQCGKCAHICPKTNAGSGMLKGGTKGIVIDVCKAVLLAAVLYMVI